MNKASHKEKKYIYIFIYIYVNINNKKERRRERHNFSKFRELCYPSEMLLVQVSACLEWPYIEICGAQSQILQTLKVKEVCAKP